MTSGERNTTMREGNVFSYALAVGAAINKGALVMLVAGEATKGAAAANAVAVGIAKETVDQAGGDALVRAEGGTFSFLNSAAADEITAADIGSDCYVVDDETVAKTNGGGTRSVAGKIRQVDSAGVWVTI